MSGPLAKHKPWLETASTNCDFVLFSHLMSKNRPPVPCINIYLQISVVKYNMTVVSSLMDRYASIIAYDFNKIPEILLVGIEKEFRKNFKLPVQKKVLPDLGLAYWTQNAATSKNLACFIWYGCFLMTCSFDYEYFCRQNRYAFWNMKQFLLHTVPDGVWDDRWMVPTWKSRREERSENLS